MGSKFLNGGSSDLTDGTAEINIGSAVIQNLLPNLPVRTTVGKQLTSGLIQLTDCAFNPITSPYAGTLEVEDLETAYNTTPVSLNSFIATTVNEVSSLQTNTQYITATPGSTNISSNVNLSTNDIRAAQYMDPTGSIFIDMTTSGEINVSATTFDFNGVPVATTASLGSYLPLAGGTMSGIINMNNQNITNVNQIIPELAIGADLGSASLPFDTMHLSTLTGPTFSRSVDNIVSNSAGSVASNIPIFSGTTGKIITDSGVPISSISGGPYLPLAGGTMSGDIAMGTHNLSNVGTLSGAANSRTADNIVSNLGISIDSNVAMFAGVSGKVVKDSGVTIASVTGGPFLALTGGTMSGAIAMGTNNLSNIGTISGATNSTIANNIVSNSGSSTSGDLVSFSSATGKAITDSAIASSIVSQTIQNSTNLSVSVGPPGFRDAWAVGTSFDSDLGITYMSSVNLWLAPNSALGLSYSSDGGVTWISTTSLTSYGYAGFSLSLNIASVKSGSTTQVQTSSDGITWTAQPNSGAAMVGNMIWSSWLNLFIAGSSTAGQTIQTSVDGINWILRTATLQPRVIVDTGSSLAALGTSGVMTSPDGITWTTQSATAYLWAAYSPLLNCIIATSTTASQNLFKSTNGGVTFTTLSNVIPVSTVFRGGFWSTYHDLFFFAQSLSANTANFYAFDGTNPMTGGSITLNGGTPALPQIYAIGYTQSLNRFFFLGNNPNSNYYSTAGNNLAVSGNLYAPNIITTIAYGAWYSSTNHSPSFTIATNILIPLSGSTNGLLSLFTQSAGVLTYTGTRSRIFKFSYNVVITNTSATSGTTLTLFNSYNASTILSTSQTTLKMQVASGTVIQYNLGFTDILIMNTNDTIELAGACSITTAGITFNFASCNIVGLLN